MAKRNKKITFEEELKKFEESIRKQKSVPFNKLSKEDQDLINNHKPEIYEWSDFHADEENENSSHITDEEFSKALKDSGQFTDEEINKLTPEERRKIYHTVGEVEKFVNLISDDIPFDQMISYVTLLFTNGATNKSFNDIVAKFFNFHLGKMELKELIVLKYKIDTMIHEKAMGNLDENYYNSQRLG